MIGNSGFIGPKVRPTTTSKGIYHLQDRYNISNRTYDETITPNGNENVLTGVLSDSILTIPSGNEDALQYWDSAGAHGQSDAETAAATPLMKAALLKYRRVWARVVVHYVSGSGVRGDFQIFTLHAGTWRNYFNDTSYYDHNVDDATYTKYNERYANAWNFSNFTAATDKWLYWERSVQTGSSSESDYDDVEWEQMVADDDRGKFNSDFGGTPTNGTGYNITSGANTYDYIYAETSGSAGRPNRNIWARSPIIYFGDESRLYIATARYGSNMGTTNFYLDIVGKNP